MKRLALILGIFLLSNCEIKMQESNADGRWTGNHYADGSFKEDYAEKVITHRGMDYLVIYKEDGTTQTGYAVTMVNLINDELENRKIGLEIEYLTRQLNKLRNE